jgi:hypothetical protein
MKSQQYLAMAHLATHYSVLKDHWQKNSVLCSDGKRGSDKAVQGDIGGKVEILDWNTKKVVWEMDLVSPTGMYFDEAEQFLYVNSQKLGCVYVIDIQRHKVVDEINNPDIDRPHSLIKTKNGFLISSTALDTVIEIDRSGNTLYKYCFVDHGYELDQFGNTRVIDWTINHQKIAYPSLTQTTHVNYAEYDDTEDGFYATLFHPGELVYVNRSTGDVHVKIKELNHPHVYRRLSNGLRVIGDTDNNSVQIINPHTFEIVKTLDSGFKWVQDVIEGFDPNSLFVSDSDNCRVVQIDLDGKIVDQYQFNDDFRLYQVLPLKNLEI